MLPALALLAVVSNPTLITPADGATGVPSPVVFAWTAVDNADGYRVSVIEESLDVDVVAETSRTSTTTRLAPGTYQWFVEAFFDDRASAVSEIHRFEVRRAEVCSDFAPILLGPYAGAEVTSPVAFSWTPSPDAIAYEITAALDDGEPVFVGETTSTSFTAHLGSGRVTWSVDAEFDGCDDISSEESTFEIPFDAACAHEAPLPIAPRLGATGVATHVDFVWTPVAGAKSYTLFLVVDNNEETRSLGTTTNTRFTANVPAGTVSWAVAANFESCSPAVSAISTFHAATPAGCTTPSAPEIALAPRARSGDAYTLLWSAPADTALHEVQEATRDDFADATAVRTSETLLERAHDAATETHYFYRVRSLSACGGGVGPWSEAASIVVSSSGAVPFGTPLVTQRVHVDGLPVPVAFTARTDKPWLRVAPASGVLPPEGLDLTLTADAQDLPIGTNTGTVIVALASSRTRGVRSNATTTAITVPVSVHLVTPVSPDTSNAPLPTSLIIPAVSRSDVRIANTSAQVMQYLLVFERLRTTIQVGPGETAALDDVLRNFFGLDDASGALEIRPLAPKTLPNISFASSRTRRQFVPAIPFAKFAGAFSLQPIARSAKVGIVEAAGESTSVLVSLFDVLGQSLGSFPLQLLPRERRTLDAPADGRIEVSSSGKVTAFASMQETLVTPAEAANRVVLPEADEVHVLDANGRLLRLPNPSGDAVIVSGPRIVATGMKNGQFIRGITPADGVGAGERALQLLQLEESERAHTTLGIVELTGNPALVEISALTPDSKVSRSTQLALAPNELRRIDGVLRALGFESAYNARITLKVVTGKGRVGGYAMVGGVYLPAL